MRLIIVVCGFVLLNGVHGDNQCAGRSTGDSVECVNNTKCNEIENGDNNSIEGCGAVEQSVDKWTTDNTKHLDKNEKNKRSNKPCAARAIPGDSIVCVCNSTYCDDFEREAPEHDKYVAYTTSESGLRLKKTIGDWNTDNTEKLNKKEENENARSHFSLLLDPSKMYQEVEGFGGAVTDAAGINWKSLKGEKLQQLLIDSYFSERGLQYNMIRVPIGGSDFSTHAYAYNELPEDDIDLSNYTLTTEDLELKIPMIKAAMSASETPVHIVASTWSPPLWMKTNRQYGGFSRLKPEYFQTYALYHLKFLEKYKEHNIPVWGITTTNEPINGLFGLVEFNSVGWTIEDMGKWISTNLGPTIRNSKFKDLKIMAGDDQRFTIPFWFNTMILRNPKALEFIDGYAVHYYADQIVSPTVFDFVAESQPDKFILSTEACEGFGNPWQNPKITPNAWQKAKIYIINILEDLNHNVTGWIDWNLCLNSEGGPNWVKNFVDSPIKVFPDEQEFIKQPMYYALAHFSRFLPRGSIRITSVPFTLSSSVQHVAFVTPRDTMVVIMYNKDKVQRVTLKYDKKQADLELPSESITTVELPYK